MIEPTEFETVENELRKRLAYPYQWPGRQNDAMDRATRFIYDTPYFNDLLLLLRRADQATFNYALNRWFNFWSAHTVERIFCSIDGVIPGPQYHRTKDFTLHGVPFDHKTTVFPRGFGGSLDDALFAPHRLIHWLYTNQSTGQRFHTGNRLFIVLYADDGQHWKLKANIGLLAARIEEYVEDFDERQLIPCIIGSSRARADVIWVVEH